MISAFLASTNMFYKLIDWFSIINLIWVGALSVSTSLYVLRADWLCGVHDISEYRSVNST